MAQRGTAVVVVSYCDDTEERYERRNVTYSEALYEATVIMNSTNGVEDVDVDFLPVQHEQQPRRNHK